MLCVSSLSILTICLSSTITLFLLVVFLEPSIMIPLVYRLFFLHSLIKSCPSLSWPIIVHRTGSKPIFLIFSATLAAPPNFIFSFLTFIIGTGASGDFFSIFPKSCITPKDHYNYNFKQAIKFYSEFLNKLIT